MVRRLKTARKSTAHQYAPQEDHNSLHVGDTDEEIEVNSSPATTTPAPAPVSIIEPDEEDPEEDVEGHEQEGDPSHHSDSEPEEATEEVVWKVYRYKQEGLGVPMADLLRATAYRLGYAPSGPAYHCELWTHP